VRIKSVSNISIDRSNFYKIGNQNIIHLFDGVSRIINQKDPYRATHDNGIDGISTIHGLKYTIDFESNNLIDNLHSNFHPNKENIFFINIMDFAFCSVLKLYSSEFILFIVFL